MKCVLDRKEAVLNTDVTIISVSAPSQMDGSINLRFVKTSAREIGEALHKKDAYHLVVVKRAHGMRLVVTDANVS